ncbi:Hypp5530 [Branchiostoma lanceolatum]|uniref:Hypp5530 protein n=1 Tax=Branchiostoma lanceolatum TaxID=7740 RepID=A0A8J9WFA0_BRALA|nr:Hypp5530 [Branchiostoma lanceolatum]
MEIGASTRTLQYQVSSSNIMAERDLPLTRPTQEEGHGEAGNGVPLQQHDSATIRRALQFRAKKIIQQASEFEKELGSGEQEEQFQADRLLSPVKKLQQSIEGLALDVGACAEHQNLTHTQQHAPNIRRGAPVRRNPEAAHTNHTAVTDNGNQVLGALGVNGDFIGIHDGNEEPRQSPSQGGAMTNLASIASPSMRSHTPAPGNNLIAADSQPAAVEPPAEHPTPTPGDILVAPGTQDATEPPVVRPTCVPEVNTPSKPSQPPPIQPPLPPPSPLRAVESLLHHDYPLRRQGAEAPQAHVERHGTQAQSWPYTNRGRASSSAGERFFMPPGTIVPSSGPKAMIHLEGEHFPRLQA